MKFRPACSLLVSLCLLGCDPSKDMSDGGMADAEATPFDDDGIVSPSTDSDDSGENNDDDTGIENGDTASDLSGTESGDAVAFPYLLVLVSGGHCQLLIVDFYRCSLPRLVPKNSIHLKSQ